MQPSFFQTEDERKPDVLYKVKSKNGVEFWCREGRADAGVVTGFMNDYERYIKTFNADETWLDIGAHIGTFAATAAPHVKKVIAIEACPETFKLLKMNTAHLPNVDCRQTAVIGPEQCSIRFVQSEGRTMSHVASAHSRSFIDVPAASFSSLLTEDVCIKMDIEGGEKSCLDSLKDWQHIKRFMLEFHSNAMHDAEHTYCKKVLTHFREVFKTVETNFNEEKHHWVWYIYGER